MEKQETKPLLEKIEVVQPSQKQQERTAPQTTKSTSSVSKKGQKVRTGTGSLTKPKLPSLHESCTEGDDASNGEKSQGTSKSLQKQYITETKQSGTGTQGSTQVSGKMSYFGIRSYLHQFYENTSQQQNDESLIGGEEDFHYLIRPKGRTCGAILFKIGLITGATLFLLGAVAIIIGYAIPTQEEIRGETDEFKIIDRNAMRFNRNLDMSKLIGLGMFCSGGLVLVISLLAPTFTSSYWEEDLTPEAFRVPLHLSPIQEDDAKSPIPVTEKIQGIQPVWTQ